MSIYEDIIIAKAARKKKFAVLIDPDKLQFSRIIDLINLSTTAQVDYFLIGGSLLMNNTISEVIQAIKLNCNIPVILFPGNPYQINEKADAILFLSMISGRNAELLIGKHVVAAPYLKKSSIEVISTGYMLIDGKTPTSVAYMSNTNPIPGDKNDIAACTAMAGEMLGLKLIYLEAGSGALAHVPAKMIKDVRRHVDVPIIVGGGIRTSRQAEACLKNGADMIVVGNAIEKDPSFLLEIAKVVKELN